MFDNIILLHGILMSISWMVLIPVSLFITRFFKITPKQDFPNKLDNKFWWYTHLSLNILAIILSTLGFYLMYNLMGFVFTQHAIFGYITLFLMYLQGMIGYFRGTTGGDYPHPRGKKWDHYHMTTRRIIFERIHKPLGYIALIFAFIAIFLHLAIVQVYWQFFIIQFVITTIIIVLYILFFNKKRYTTYQAIFGLDAKHPGNQFKNHN